jgi:hypothetical protein
MRNPILDMDDKQEKAKGRETLTDLILLSSKVWWRQCQRSEQR